MSTFIETVIDWHLRYIHKIFLNYNKIEPKVISARTRGNTIHQTMGRYFDRYALLATTHVVSSIVPIIINTSALNRDRDINLKLLVFESGHYIDPKVIVNLMTSKVLKYTGCFTKF